MRKFSALLSVAVIGGMSYFVAPALGKVVFQDDFQGHTVGDAVVNLVPPVGEGYYWLGANHYGFIDGNATNPPGGADGDKFVGGLPSLAGYGQQNLVITEADEIAATSQVVQFNMDAYVVGNGIQNYGLDLSTFASGGLYVGRAWDINLQTNGTLSIYDASGYNNVPGGSYRTDTWIPVEVVADYGAGTFQATVDGFTFGGNFSPDPENITFRRVSINQAGYSPAFIDNVSVTIPGLGVPGDYNDNGAVDAADYAVWRDNLGADITLPNEVVTSGMVTSEDYDEWKARFGNTSGSGGGGLGVGTVPEPTAVLLAILAGLGTIATWRCRWF